MIPLRTSLSRHASPELSNNAGTQISSISSTEVCSKQASSKIVGAKMGYFSTNVMSMIPPGLSVRRDFLHFYYRLERINVEQELLHPIWIFETVIVCI